jgi:flagellar biosynthetic protein FliP
VTRVPKGAHLAGFVACLFFAFFAFLGSSPAGAQTPTTTVTTTRPTATSPATPASPTAVAPSDPATPTTQNNTSLTIDLANANAKGSGAGPVQVIVLVTLIALAPAVLMLVTSFTRIVIVLGLTRNALGLQGVPPNQVIVGLSLFLTLFIMGPVFGRINSEALQPYLNKQISQQEAYNRGVQPIREFMTKQVRQSDLALFVDLSGKPRPASTDDVPLSTLIPAYVIGELRAAFIIGFIVYLPLLIIDIVTSASLMSMGMVMVQPTTVALPFKLLLFVLVDGWQLLAGSLVRSFVT